MVEFVAQLRQFIRTLLIRRYTKINDMLCDRIVCGINDQCIQRHLLVELDLTLAKAMELSLAMESADKDADTLNARAMGITTQPHVKAKNFNIARYCANYHDY